VPTSYKTYGTKDKERAIALANKLGVTDAAFFLNVPTGTLYKWTREANLIEKPKERLESDEQSEEDKIFVTRNLWKAMNESIHEFSKQLVDLKAAVEILTDVYMKEIETRESLIAVSCKN